MAGMWIIGGPIEPYRGFTLQWERPASLPWGNKQVAVYQDDHRMAWADTEAEAHAMIDLWCGEAKPQ